MNWKKYRVVFNRMMWVLVLCISTKGLLAQTPAGSMMPNNVERAVQAMMMHPELKNASFTFQAINLADGAEIASYNPNQTLVPASVQKVVTTATALEICGATYRVRTKIQYDGRIDSAGVLHGNLYIKGGGDPALMSDRFKKRYENTMQSWVDSIKALGITEVKGAVIGDASVFSGDLVPSTWIWGDIANYYGAPANGLSYRDNTVEVQFKTGPERGDSTEVVCTQPYVPYLMVDNEVVSSKTNKDLAYFYGAPFDDYRMVEGSLPMNEDSFSVKASLPDPAHQVAFELEAALWQNGVKVNHSATTVRRLKQQFRYLETERTDITYTNSPALSTLVYYTNMYSVNLYAEHILNWIALRKSGRGSTNSGTILIKRHWQNKGVDALGMYPNDGSGLSRFNALSAAQLVGILRHMKKSKQYDAFYNSLPVAGKSGTLKSVGRNTAAYNNLRAKSGTMTRVKSYAGYVKSKSGKNLAFAMILNNCNCGAGAAKKHLERLLVALAEYNR